MKNSRTKLLAVIFILLLAFAAPLSLACSNEAEAGGDKDTAAAGDETKPAEEDDGTVSDDLPDYDFEQREFTMAVYERAYNNSTHFGSEINGDVYNDALWNRNRYIEERFNVKLVETISSYDYVNTGSMNSIRAGDSEYDLLFPFDMGAYKFVQEGLIFNFADLQHIDLTKPYWDQSLLGYTTILGEVYYAFNDFDVTFYDHTHVLMFSKRVADDFDLENMYKLVADGKWTFDKMGEMMLKVKADPDAGGSGGRWGFLSQPKQVLPDFWIAAGEMTIKKDADDVPYYALIGNERFINAANKVFDMMHDAGAWYFNTESANMVFSKISNFFEAGEALFADNAFGFLGNYRELDVNFGILPFPKLDEIQQEYYSRVEAGCKLAVVPITNPKPDEAGLMLEALASASREILLPGYYDTALKIKNVRDVESSEMIDFIFSNRVYDLGDTWFTSQIRDGVFRDMYRDNKRSNLVSSITAIEGSISKLIEQTVNSFK